jgi:hypothetical protein
MRNTGTTTWTEAGAYRIGSQNPQDNWNWGASRVYLSAGESIAPGQTKTFSFLITAPTAKGVYKFQWKMLQDAVEWFGDFSQNVNVVDGARIYTGVYTGAGSGLPGNPYTLDLFESDAGKGMSIYGVDTWWYVFAWGDFDTMGKNWSDNTRNHGAIPLIMWQPYNPCRGDPCCDPADASCGGIAHNCAVEDCTFGVVKETDKDFVSHSKKYSLKRIAAGDFDSYLRTWASQIKAWGKPVMLRPMHEMNTVGTLKSCWGNPAFPMTWATYLYDTDCATFVNEPQDAVNAWRRIVDIFRQEGANVTWVWSLLSWPSAAYGGNNPTSMSSIYPGDDYVDWIGIECYNFNPGSWAECNSTLDASYREASALSAIKPMMLAEMGSIEKTGDPQGKPEWIRNALAVERDSSFPNNYPRIKAFFWWNDGSLSIQPSDASVQAFKESIASDLYTANAYQNLLSFPIPPPDQITITSTTTTTTTITTTTTTSSTTPTTTTTTTTTTTSHATTTSTTTTRVTSTSSTTTSTRGTTTTTTSSSTTTSTLITCSSTPDTYLSAGINSVVFQTPHPYYNSMDCYSGIYTCASGYSVRIHAKYDIESWYDYFYVYNSISGNVTLFSGNSSGFVWVNSGYNSVRFRFMSDESIARWGVDVDRVDCYAASTTTTSSTTTLMSTTTTTLNTTSTSTTAQTTTSTTLSGPCTMKGNEPPCDVVTLSEVVDSINQWATGNLNLGQVIDLINSWADPLVYPSN